MGLPVLTVANFRCTYRTTDPSVLIGLRTECESMLLHFGRGVWVNNSVSSKTHVCRQNTSTVHRVTASSIAGAEHLVKLVIVEYSCLGNSVWTNDPAIHPRAVQRESDYNKTSLCHRTCWIHVTYSCLGCRVRSPRRRRRRGGALRHSVSLPLPGAHSSTSYAAQS